eukprot:CAMPEP_0198214402 /NCGR_PEP_ID=MMETSP1445-20131203/41198_1 /TAXON_ID=36898 /ORGANISM="Pyramimonas sp., Strain CCMP2087" /LENGTH=196 /DNA_ID=CAMNT_0043889591 /DNA_START=63 /DNA_END=650 /DNA_ORIENTATION=+
MNRVLAIRKEVGASPVRSSRSAPTAVLRPPATRALFDRKLFDALHGECLPGRASEHTRSPQRKVSDQLLAAMRSIPAEDRVMTCPSFHKLATTKASFYDTYFYFGHSDILHSLDRINLDNPRLSLDNPRIPSSGGGEDERRGKAEEGGSVGELTERSAGSWTIGALCGSFSWKREQSSPADSADAPRLVQQARTAF